MGGRASRQKGKRGERLVRDYFRGLGYNAKRVVGSGAHESIDARLRGDVQIEVNGELLSAEVKVRQNEFKSIYALYETLGSRPRLFSYNRLSACVSHSFSDLGYTSPLTAEAIVCDASANVDLKAVKKLFGLSKFVKTCDFLVIKIDRKPLLFIRYLV